MLKEQIKNILNNNYDYYLKITNIESNFNVKNNIQVNTDITEYKNKFDKTQIIPFVKKFLESKNAKSDNIEVKYYYSHRDLKNNLIDNFLSGVYVILFFFIPPISLLLMGLIFENWYCIIPSLISIPIGIIIYYFNTNRYNIEISIKNIYYSNENEFLKQFVIKDYVKILNCFEQRKYRFRIDLNNKIYDSNQNTMTDQLRIFFEKKYREQGFELTYYKNDVIELRPKEELINRYKQYFESVFQEDNLSEYIIKYFKNNNFTKKPFNIEIGINCNENESLKNDVIDFVTEKIKNFLEKNEIEYSSIEYKNKQFIINDFNLNDLEKISII